MKTLLEFDDFLTEKKAGRIGKGAIYRLLRLKERKKKKKK